MRGLAAPLLRFTVFAVVTIALTTVLGATIQRTTLGATTSYSAEFSTASGISVGDDVRIVGVRVGQVSALEVTPDATASVTFEIEGGRRIPATTEAAIRYRNLIGQRYLALDASAGGPPMADDGVIPMARTRPALDLTALFNGFRPLFQALSPNEVNQLSQEIIQVLQGEGGTVQSLLERTGSLTSTLASRDQVIGQVIDNLDLVLGTVAERGPQFSALLDTVQRLVSGLARQREPLGRAIASIGEVTDATAGLLVDARPPLAADIAALGDLAGTLDANAPLLESTVRGLPEKLQTLTRQVTYGSWFNFYLCQLTVQTGVGPLQLGVPVAPLPITQTAQRCR